MIHAYNEWYLEDATRNLGEALDYAVYGCHMEMDAFFDCFLASGLARQFGLGVPRVVCGISGTELVWEVLEKVGIGMAFPDARIEYSCSMEYWCGWILAYYQWYSGRVFRDIVQHVSVSEVGKLYPTLHEASEEKCVFVFEQMYKRDELQTRLKTFRRLCGYSQRVLSEKSGVNLRTLQQYETRAKDINKAAGGTLLSLSRALGCQMEDLLEMDDFAIDL